ncbi:SpaA isopeptide-forming pilin-related protein [Listeria seeligeri]|uniref:SpaA isopeptide-forming pilin-related protein n=1 Tax=Listeria seeligeri TaxID=1640 RepID=UPI0022EBD813|nr:SpaA isopeptide-forming pilin-related protein [Listeria seeligeri]
MKLSTNKANFKRIGLLFLSAILLVNVVFQTSALKADAATSYGSDFLKTVELQDDQGNTSTDFDNYDNIKIHYSWEIPNSTDVKAGDTMDFTLPAELKLQTNLSFALKDSKGNVVGNAVASSSTGKVTVTFTDYVENNSDINGALDFWSGWNKEITNEAENYPVEFPLNGETTTITVDISGNPISPTETVLKYGWVDQDNPEIIHWVVRVNYAEINIENAVYEDTIGANQTLDFSSVQAYHGSYSGELFTKGVQVPATAFSQTDTGFKVALGDISDSVRITYDTVATDGGASDKYTNDGSLTGDNYVTQEIQSETPYSGGNGSGDGTTGSVELTKTDDTAQKNPLEGAEFKLVNSAGATVQEKLSTDADGILSISQLKFDTYQLIETKAPAGYVLDDTPVEFTLDSTHQAISVTKENTTIKGSVSLTKTDSATAAVLAGAEFELQDSTGKTLQTGLTTNEQGILTVTDLELGDYQLVETKAPAGYVLDNTPVKFTLDETHQTISVAKENTTIKGSVSLTKTDSATAEVLAGAEFELQDSTGKTLQTGLITNEEGMLIITDLELGDYQLVETKAPAGYELDSTPVVFTIGQNSTNVSVTKENTKIPAIPDKPLTPDTPEMPIIPKKPVIPVIPSTPAAVLPQAPISRTVIKETTSMVKLPKTGDTPLQSGLGLLLVALSTGSLILLRKNRQG